MRLRRDVGVGRHLGVDAVGGAQYAWRILEIAGACSPHGTLVHIHVAQGEDDGRWNGAEADGEAPEVVPRAREVDRDDHQESEGGCEIPHDLP